MTLNYTKITYNKIEKGIRNVINNEFRNTYISSKFKKQSGNESIRVCVKTKNVLEFTNMSETLEYEVLVRYYLHEKLTESSEKYAKTRTDRLQKLLFDNIQSDGNYYNLSVNNVEYFIEDDENAENNELQIIDLNLTTNYIYIK